MSKNDGIDLWTRQGCPLSLLLFILALEPLAEAVRTHPDDGDVEVAGSAHKISLFIDNILLTLTHPRVSWPNQSLLDTFASLSGLHVNLTKSKAMLVNLSSSELAAFPFQWLSSLPYLGIRLTPRYERPSTSCQKTNRLAFLMVPFSVGLVWQDRGSLYDLFPETALLYSASIWNLFGFYPSSNWQTGSIRSQDQWWLVSSQFASLLYGIKYGSIITSSWNVPIAIVDHHWSGGFSSYPYFLPALDPAYSLPNYTRPMHCSLFSMNGILSNSLWVWFLPTYLYSASLIAHYFPLAVKILSSFPGGLILHLLISILCSTPQVSWPFRGF